jgi:hypothetical protein
MAVTRRPGSEKEPGPFYWPQIVQISTNFSESLCRRWAQTQMGKKRSAEMTCYAR